ncbi:hypothetical protein COK90_20640 [Priestia megaterium]|uniref:hypothetical protein n=1 Tax=Priestia megaterium TaxID=1404 RepID=UPI000BF6CAFA|nr:hypothetical protein [Priestia megaterium]PFU58445.1 hypothetical protein COK90_20640 [Priestia megaterium]
MIKYAIRLHNNNRDASLIFHAAPDSEGHPLSKFQWYLTEDKNLVGQPIENALYESYITHTKRIKEEGYEGLYLYCKFTYLEANKENTTEFIKLSSDITKIIDSGTVFDEISMFDENGQIT